MAPASLNVTSTSATLPDPSPSSAAQFPSPTPASQSPPFSATQRPELPPENVSVTVDAITDRPSQRSSPSTIAPPSPSAIAQPSRGALIAFGVLTVFFVTLIMGLLLWRRRKSRRQQKDPLATMEEIGQHQQSSVAVVEKAPCPSRSSSPKEQPPVKEMAPRERRPKDGEGKLFGHRGISRGHRPTTLPLQGTPQGRSSEIRIPKMQSQEQRGRPVSWRSSIASVWESLGLPSRVLQEPSSSMFCSDAVSVHSPSSSTRHLTGRPSAISEESTLDPPPSSPLAPSGGSFSSSQNPALKSNTTLPLRLPLITKPISRPISCAAFSPARSQSLLAKLALKSRPVSLPPRPSFAVCTHQHSSSPSSHPSPPNIHPFPPSVPRNPI
ncbi:uncharacterized protein VP01_196g15 [Puccinia sorghi]|uniref:Uncharacterized protein n=1 Tax=Puccinia sorghi TaxID=27349 RepID=A0A0L6VBT6_9BASI|nr:uncharacterized protein VP01_196g15 [Puccinia sorghi]